MNYRYKNSIKTGSDFVSSKYIIQHSKGDSNSIDFVALFDYFILWYVRALRIF